jgi:hypothetical protein
MKKEQLTMIAMVLNDKVHKYFSSFDFFCHPTSLLAIFIVIIPN